MKIYKNSAQCRNCGDEIESKHRHDFVVCSCWKDSIAKFNLWEEENPNATHEEKCNWQTRHGTGIAVDGGGAYLRRLGKITDIIETSIYDDEEEDLDGSE